MTEDKRATREATFSHLRELLGEEALSTSRQVHKLALEKKYEESLSTPKNMMPRF